MKHKTKTLTSLCDSEKTKIDDDSFSNIDLENNAKIEFDSKLSSSMTLLKSDSACISSDKREILSFSEEDEKKLVKKLDLRIMPLICIFYFADFLDRANIGNATLAGLQSDLSMTASELSTAISAFFITYIIFEVPSNIVLKKTNPAIWLSFIMLIWGIATLIMAFVTNFTGLLITRLILGAAESGYIPGIMFLLSKMYKPKEFSFRVGILLTMMTLSGLVSGPLTYAMSFLDGKNNMHDWQYLFVFEGVPTIVLSIVSYFCLVGDLQKVKWLSTEEKALQITRMSAHLTHDNNDSPITLNTLKVTMTDWKTWAFAMVFLLNSINVTSITVFAPTLIDGFGFETLTAQLLTAPPCAIATVGVLLGGYLSGKYNCRSPILVVGSIIIAFGYLFLLLLQNKWALYTTLFLVPIGMGLQGAAAIGWSAINYEDLSIRAIAVAVVLMIGNIGSIIASYLFREQDAPRYAFGLVFNLITAIVSGLLSALTGYLLYNENRKRDKNPTETNQFRFFY